jgi:hypothetical protein
MWRATNQESGQSRGKRHVIVFSSVEENRIAGHGLIASVQSGRVPIQVISSGPNQQLQEFCKRTRSMHTTSMQEEIGELIEQAYLHLLARFEIAYLPLAANSPNIKLRVQTPVGWGETLVPIAPRTDEGS